MHAPKFHISGICPLVFDYCSFSTATIRLLCMRVAPLSINAGIKERNVYDTAGCTLQLLWINSLITCLSDSRLLIFKPGRKEGKKEGRKGCCVVYCALFLVITLTEWRPGSRLPHLWHWPCLESPQTCYCLPLQTLAVLARPGLPHLAPPSATVTFWCHPEPVLLRIISCNDQELQMMAPAALISADSWKAWHISHRPRATLYKKKKKNDVMCID